MDKPKTLKEFELYYQGFIDGFQLGKKESESESDLPPIVHALFGVFITLVIIGLFEAISSSV